MSINKQLLKSGLCIAGKQLQTDSGLRIYSFWLQVYSNQI